MNIIWGRDLVSVFRIRQGMGISSRPGKLSGTKRYPKESSNRRFDYIGLIVNVVSRLKTVFLFV